MAREPTDRVNITLRISEKLRMQLEAAADVSGHSLNAEIGRRLERGFEARSIVAELFGSEQVFSFVSTLTMALKGIEARIGLRNWREDQVAQDAIGQAIAEVQSAYTTPVSYWPARKIDEPFPDPGSAAIGKEVAQAALKIGGPS